MEYKRFENTLVVRLDPKEEICEQLLSIANTERLGLAEVSGLGAVNEFTVGVFDTASKEYRSNVFQGPYEIVSLTGTLTRKENEPYLHLHFAAGDQKGHVVGGHLNRAVVSATAELIVRVIDGVVERAFHDEIGLNLFAFPNEKRGE